MMASAELSTKYNVWPTNQSAKPPLEGVSLAWRLNHAIHPLITRIKGRALELVSHRRARYTHGPVLKQMALLSVMTHNRNRIQDGQVGILTMPSLATSQSGQDLS